MAEYLDVLVLCADPVNLRRTLNLAQELVHFEHVIRSAGLPIRLRRVVPPTLEQLTREFALAERWGRQPGVFHFLGHGDDDGLYFETEHGEFQLVKGHQLRSVLAASPVDLVLLNACWSATRRGVSLCDFLTREQVARAAIGHERPVADASAIGFARQFYALITQGRTVRDACLRAANALAEQGQLGAADVKLVGDGAFALTHGLSAGSRPCIVDPGLPSHGHLPEAGAFFGRADELVQISHALADAGLAGFALWGIGGIGKTALARASARRNAWRYQGAVWVDIRDATQKTTAELLRLALCRLHPGAPDADAAFELTRRLENAPSLVVLDNLEDLPESEHAALARFIEQLPRNGSHVLLTARVPLPAVERLPAVRSRRMTEGLDLRNGAYYVQHVARQKHCQTLLDDGQLREENGQLLGLCVQVARRLHGHPKMLELAVGVALQGRTSLEQALSALPDELEQQLAAMLATSLRHLGPDGQRVLPLLGFFPTGTATPEALDVVARIAGLSAAAPPTSEAMVIEADDEADDEPDLSWLMRGRAQLLAAGLLDYDQTQDVVTFHQSILDEAVRRRPDDEISGTATAALLMHYAAYLRDNRADNVRLDRCAEAALVLMESIWSGREQESPVDAILADMTRFLGNYLRERGLWRIAEQWHERAIELRQSSSHARDNAALAAQYFHQGQVLAMRSQPAAAREALKQAMTLWEQAGEQRGVGLVLHQLAIIESAQGNPSEARRLLQRSIGILESLGDQRGLAASLHELARIESAQGNPSEGRRLLQRSIGIFESLGDQRGLAASLHELAGIEIQAGDRDAARQLWERSIGSKERIGDVAGAAQTRIMLAQLEGLEGRFGPAIELATAGVRELEKLGYADAEQARVLLREIEESAAQCDAPQGAGASYLDRLKQLIAAWQSLSGDQRAERVAALEAIEPVEAALGWLAHSAVCWQQGDAPGCDAALDAARTIARACDDGELLGLVDALSKGRAAAGLPAEGSGPEVLTSAIKLWEQGDTAGATELLEKVSALARAAGNRLAEATCLFYLGQAHLLSGRAADAVVMLREALDLATEADDPELIRAVQQVLTIAVQEGKASEDG